MEYAYSKEVRIGWTVERLAGNHSVVASTCGRERSSCGARFVERLAGTGAGLRIADRCLEIQGRVGLAHIERCAGRLDPAAVETREVGWHKIHLTSGLDRGSSFLRRFPEHRDSQKTRFFARKRSFREVRWQYLVRCAGKTESLAGKDREARW